jgi:Flp pilus assembly protein TadG
MIESWRDQHGSLTVELVVLMPALFIVVLTIIAFGRVSDSRQQVADAAQAGAESAAVSPGPSSAASNAAFDAAAAVAGRAHSCVQPQINTDLGHFYPGGFVRVTVTCQVSLSDLSVPGIPGATSIQATSTAPIDPYRTVG